MDDVHGYFSTILAFVEYKLCDVFFTNEIKFGFIEYFLGIIRNIVFIYYRRIIATGKTVKSFGICVFPGETADGSNYRSV